MKRFNIAVFASHNGSNFQAIIDASKKKMIKSSVKLLITNNSESYCIQRAKDNGILHFHLSEKSKGSIDALNKSIISILEKNNINLILLAGYMKKIDLCIIRKYKNKIINIHPALLPNYGGKGMYGINVHKAVIENKEKKSGITVHFVNEIYDNGTIVIQKEIDIFDTDNADSLQKRILNYEHKYLVEAVQRIEKGEISLKNE